MNFFKKLIIILFITSTFLTTNNIYPMNSENLQKIVFRVFALTCVLGTQNEILFKAENEFLVFYKNLGDFLAICRLIYKDNELYELFFN